MTRPIISGAVSLKAASHTSYSRLSPKWSSCAAIWNTESIEV
jgi:hypothetical protein